MNYLISIVILFLYLISPPVNTLAFDAEMDLNSAQTSVGTRFAKVFCEAKSGGVNSEAASEYALNNTFLKFVSFPDDDNYIDQLWSFTAKSITENCGSEIDSKEINDLEIFFKEEGLIASNRELFLPTFENN